MTMHRAMETFGVKPSGEALYLQNACAALPPKSPRSWKRRHAVLMAVRATVLQAQQETGADRTPKDWRVQLVFADRLEELGFPDAAMVARLYAAGRGYRLAREGNATTPEELRYLLSVLRVRGFSRAAKKSFWQRQHRGRAQLELAKLRGVVLLSETSARLKRSSTNANDEQKGVVAMTTIDMTDLTELA
jgi:hypothetical protein